MNDITTQQLDKMVKFLDHSAEVKEQKIDSVAEEKYNIEKEKLIHKGIMEVNQLYNNKTKLLNKERAIMISIRMTRAKLEILRSRDNHIKSVMADVNKKLTKIRYDKTQYKQILKKLILQALYQILEKEVTIMLISNDVELVKSMISELEKTYRENTGMKVKINIENIIKLPIQEICGILMTSKNQKIIVENTLVARLLRLTQQTIPYITSGLFGPNPTRTVQKNACIFL